jgi:hypothetical protein
VDLTRFWQVLEFDATAGRGQLLVDDLVAEVDALVADVDAGAGDQLLDLTLRLAAEAAEELLVRIGGTCQRDLLLAGAVAAYRRRAPKLRGDGNPAFLGFVCLLRDGRGPFPRAKPCGRSGRGDRRDRFRNE